MKWPENLELAQRCEQIVRDNGAIPATVAVLDGELHVGLESDQVTRLALAGKSAHKVSKRDLPIVTARVGDRVGELALADSKENDRGHYCCSNHDSGSHGRYSCLQYGRYRRRTSACRVYDGHFSG